LERTENGNLEELSMGMQIKNLNKEFENITLFNDFNIVFPENEITCILGPSGCGKTTLLNIIGNVLSADSGSLNGFEGKAVSYIFQEPRLLPWKTVAGNIEFVISRDITAVEREEIISRFMKFVELDDFANYYPSQLSGGMKQRVAIARAFAYASDVILMDEPLKGVDIALKQNLIRSFSRVWQTDRRTVIFVTHDVDEALMLGDEIVVFSNAPVRVLARERFNEPVVKRNIEKEPFKQLKTKLLEILAETE